MPIGVASILAFCVLVIQAQGQTTYDEQATRSGSKVSCIDDNPLAKELPPAGPACEHELFARRGHPFMFPARMGIAFGISSEPDKPSSLHLWVDNQTDKPEVLYVCCTSTLFSHLDIYDLKGHRILSKSDHLELKARSEGRELVSACSCSGWFTIAGHTIRMVDFADVSVGYDLLPGQYVLSERSPAGLFRGDPDKYEGSPHVPAGLLISIQ